MRVVITGATGNVGTSLVDRLAGDPACEEVVGIARRAPAVAPRGVRYEPADVATGDLAPLFRGADAVVHLAWRLQPSRDRLALEQTNVGGSRRVFDAAVAAGVRTIVHASSIGVYSPGPKDQLVDEGWSRQGIDTSLYSRQKARVEDILDELEASDTSVRVVRMRPALVFKRDAASDIRRLFLGPLVPRFVFDPDRVPVVPDHPRLRFQCVHSLDVGEGYRLALHRDVSGAFNLAAEPVIDPAVLSDILSARRVKVSREMMRRAAATLWRMRVVPTDEGWLDMALDGPLIDSGRARAELGWAPTRPADDTLFELVSGLRDGAGLDTPPMQPRRGLAMFRAADPG